MTESLPNVGPLVAALMGGGGNVALSVVRSIVRSWPGLALVVTPEGGILAAAVAWEPVTGHTVAELEASGWATLVHPDDLAGVVAQVEAQREQATKGYRCRWVTPAGVIGLSWDAAPWTGAGGREFTLAVAELVEG